MRYGWVTDIHLNFLTLSKRHKFYETLKKEELDGILITGDIAEGTNYEFLLNEMCVYTDTMLYFVRGNHDFYHDSLYRESGFCNLDVTDIHLDSTHIAKGVWLLGLDGWYDMKYGDYTKADFFMTDWKLIHEFSQICKWSKNNLFKDIKKVCDKFIKFQMKEFKQQVKEVIDNITPKKIIILTHVPPFEEVCTYFGEPTQEDKLPFYSNKTLGDYLLKIAGANEDIEFLVLCGHTHDKAEAQILPNLMVKVGHAEYGEPELQEIIEV